MSVTYIDAMQRAWRRMVHSLFRPFDLKKWFVVGFTAFLAGLNDWPSGGSGSGNGDVHSLEEIIEFPHYAYDWLIGHPTWYTLILFGLAILLLFIVVTMWLSSRGKFMLLDNVTHDRALVKDPWHRFRDPGNSLFLWRLGFGIVVAFVLISYLVSAYFNIYELYQDYASDGELISAALRKGLIFLLMIIVSAYISLFLNDFVVPLMYKYNLRAWVGWSRFIPLLMQYFFYFLWYGIVILLLYLLVGVLIVLASLLTCCIAVIFLVIPYISSVVLLPVSYFFRSFSIEFLGQFGPEFRVFEGTEQPTDTLPDKPPVL